MVKRRSTNQKKTVRIHLEKTRDQHIVYLQSRPCINRKKIAQFLLRKAVKQSLLEFCCENVPTLLVTYNFVETPHKFIIAELSIRKLGISSVLIMLMKIRAYGSKALR